MQCQHSTIMNLMQAGNENNSLVVLVEAHKAVPGLVAVGEARIVGCSHGLRLRMDRRHVSDLAQHNISPLSLMPFVHTSGSKKSASFSPSCGP